MRSLLTLIAATALCLGGPAHAQGPDFSIDYNWKPTPPPSLPAYGGSSGSMLARDCVNALRWASAKAYQKEAAKLRENGTAPEPKAAALVSGLKSMGGLYPFLEQAAMDRESALKARLECQRDPRAEKLAPAALRSQLALLSRENENRASICVPLTRAVATMLNRDTKAMNAKAGKPFTPHEVGDFLRKAAAAQEMIGDIEALCPTTEITALEARAGQITASLEALTPSVLAHPDFKVYLVNVTTNAAKAALTASAPQATDAQIAADCGSVALNYGTLLSTAEHALAIYAASDRITAREKAALRMVEACWTSSEAVRAAAAGFPAA